MRSLIPVLLLALATSACVAPSKDYRPPKRTKVERPLVRVAEPELKQCLADLGKMQSRYNVLPNQDFGGGCSQRSNIQLLAASVPVSNVKAVKCGVARNLALWVQTAVQPAAREMFDSPVVRIDSMGGYACRNVVGNAAASGNRSEHATGNAIDIAGFVLANGRRITLESGWRGKSDEQEFLRSIRASACKRFQTVLSPDYNAAHYNHLHLDMGRGPYCR